MGVKPFDIRNIGRTGLIDPKQLGYQDSLDIIREELHRTRRSFVKIGWYLKHIREEEMYREENYANIYELAADKFNLSQPTATRFMNICEQFSIDHDSPELDEKYIDFNMSQLFEMLPMNQEEMSLVTPDMTVAQIRDFKRKAKEEETVPDHEDIPGQTSIQKDFREYMPDGYEDEKKTIPESEKATEIIDGEYREVPQEQGEEVATSQGEITQEECDAYWFVRQYMEILPGDAETAIEVCRAEGDDSKRGKALQEYISPYGCHHTGCSEWQFDFLNFSKGVDMRIGTAKMRLTYNWFAKVLMEVGAEKEKKDKQNCTDEKLSAYGLPITEYPEGSLLTTEGCGNRHSCFSCAQDCGIRQKDRYCREAPMGNPFPCTTMNTLELLGREMGDICQFIDQEKAYHRAGDNAADPCCKECSEICGYRCARSVAEPHEVKESADTLVESEEPEESRAEQKPKKCITGWNQYGVCSCCGFGDVQCCAQCQKACNSRCSWINEPYIPYLPAPVQPELPPLKNADQRKEWLWNYKAWGLWYRDENIDVNYYKYDFSDGSRLIVAEYPQRQAYWRKGAVDESFFHLLEKGKKGYMDIPYDEKYRNMADSETYLVEFLKNIQKR